MIDTRYPSVTRISNGKSGVEFQLTETSRLNTPSYSTQLYCLEWRTGTGRRLLQPSISLKKPSTMGIAHAEAHLVPDAM